MSIEQFSLCAKQQNKNLANIYFLYTYIQVYGNYKKNDSFKIVLTLFAFPAIIFFSLFMTLSKFSLIHCESL